MQKEMQAAVDKGLHKPHTFLVHTQVTPTYQSLPTTSEKECDRFCYFINVYVNDYIGQAMATLWAQLDHVANLVMYAIHDIFLPDQSDEDDTL